MCINFYQTQSFRDREINFVNGSLANLRVPRKGAQEEERCFNKRKRWYDREM